MKSKTLLCFIMILTILALFSACNEPINGNGINGSPQPPLSICVLKLKKPEYKNYVLVSHFENEDYYSSIRGNHCDELTGKSGYSPYWELSDNWLLVDWKWVDFPYAIETALTNVTWEQYEWHPDIDIPCPKWPLTEPHTEENPIDRKIQIKLNNLQNYSKTPCSDEMYSIVFASTADLLAGEQHICLCDIPEKVDSIWSILQHELSAAIENGDLEHINDTIYN